MPTEIIDLDAALPPDKKVRLAGATYTLPGDLPVELFLRVQRASSEMQTNVDEDTVRGLSDAILELFRTRNPQMKALPTSLGIGQLVTMLISVYGGGDPVIPPTTRGATKPKRSTNRSRS